MSGEKPYDGADLDDIQEVIASPGYGLIMERLASELERRRAELESANGEQLIRAQGQVAALRTAIRIPLVLQEEIRGALKASAALKELR